MKERQAENDTTGIGKKNDTGKVQALDGKGIEKLGSAKKKRELLNDQHTSPNFTHHNNTRRIQYLSLLLLLLLLLIFLKRFMNVLFNKHGG